MRRVIELTCAGLVCVPLTLAAQVRASERGSVSQTVDGTVITLDYSRPLARGRDSLFGTVVRWGETWTPGANWATTLEVSRPIRLNDQTVPAGKYAVWMIPQAEGAWTVFLSARTRAFHTQKPTATDARVAAFTVEPRTAAHTEVLTWSFPAVSGEGAELQFAWGTTVVPLSVKVEPSRPTARAGRSLAPYLGQYRIRFEPDSGGTPYEDTVELFEQNGMLRARLAHAWPGMDPEFDLLPENDHFTSRFYQGGKVYEEDRETQVVFLMEGGRAGGFELRFEGEAYARGERVK
jgi:hypothetical protein